MTIIVEFTPKIKKFFSLFITKNMNVIIAKILKNMAVELACIDHREIYKYCDPICLLQKGVETEKEEIIAVENIIRDDSIISPTHAKKLGKSMQEEDQLTNVALRARLLDGKIVYDVIDGFHRVEGKRITGEKDIDALVLYGCSDEEMFDRRILAVSSVMEIQFARVADWITKSYTTTTWSKKGVGINRAFRMTVSNTKNSSDGLINPNEISDLKEWVRKKCDKWGKQIGTVRNELLLVNQSDPSLIKEVRTVRTKKESLPVITQQKLGIVVKQFPGEQNFAIQRAIFGYTTKNLIDTDQIRKIVNFLKGIINPNMREESLEWAINKACQSIPKKIYHSNGLSECEEDLDLDELDEDSIEFENDFFDYPEEGFGKNTPHKHFYHQPKITRKGALGQGNAHDAIELQTRIKDLEKAINKATSSEKSTVNWWQTASYLSPIERTCIEEGLFKHCDLNLLAKQLNISVMKIYTIMRSAFIKKNLLQKEEAVKCQ